METETVNQMKEAYENNDLKECKSKLFLLVLSYNANIMEGKSYDHDLKHILFKTNYIRNPMGLKYTFEDYKKMRAVLMHAISLANAINNPDIETPDMFQKNFAIDNRIIKDILDLVVYTDCFYKMNSINSKRIDDSYISKNPFVEQLISILVFYQDQSHILRQEYKKILTKTGLQVWS